MRTCFQYLTLTFGVCLSALSAHSQTSEVTKPATRPNIIFIISDDHRWDCIGAAGNPNVKTPQLDKLAIEGVHFPLGTVLTPQCSPCRASLLTGLPPHQSGWYSNQTQTRKVHAPDGFKHLPTVPRELNKAGYRTVLVGKWHLTPEPWNCGFSDVRTWLPGGGGPFKNTKLARGNSRETTVTEGFLQDVLGKDAEAFIRSPEATKQPFFLWLALTAPHMPLKPNPPHLDTLYANKSNAELAPPKFTRGTAEEQLTSFTVFPKRKAARAAKPGASGADDESTTAGRRNNREVNWRDYYAAVSSVDEQVGRVRDALAAANLTSNTVIVFMGDNGMMRGSRGWEGKVLPFEESVRVPMLVFDPSAKHHGKSNALISSQDLSPTFLHWAGVEIPETWRGRDVRPALNSNTAPGFDQAVCEFADNVSEKFGPIEYRLVRTEDSKLIQWRDPDKGEQLFDLKTDPRESKNLSKNPGEESRLEELRTRLIEWQKATQDDGSVNPADLVKGEGED